MSVIDNPVSRGIVNSIWNRFDEYLPKIIFCPNGGYYIKARLPEAEHKKWIARILGNPNFRDNIIEEIKNIFSSYSFQRQSFLEVRWKPHGASFETNGVNGCNLYVPPSGEYGYTCHNIDNFEQACILFIALAVYLPKLYFQLENFEGGKYNIEKSAQLETPPH